MTICSRPLLRLTEILSNTAQILKWHILLPYSWYVAKWQIFTSCVSDRGHRIGAIFLCVCVCLCVNTLTAKLFVSLNP